MKHRTTKFVAVVLVVVLASSLVGCGRLARMFEAGPVVVDEAADGTTVEVSGGERLIVNLPANMSTGYSWAVASPGPLEQQGEPTYSQKEDPTGKVVGAGGTQTFEFVANPSGSGKLALEYRRPWETGVAAEKTWSVTVEVR